MITVFKNIKGVDGSDRGDPLVLDGKATNEYEKKFLKTR